jgi:molybdopterin-guanine dinucleotide biosynthesis protein A
LRRIGGRPLLAQIVDRLRSQVSALVLNANGDPERFAAYGLSVVADGIPGHPGPLAGVLAVLDWAAAQGVAEWVVTVPGDAPFIPPDLVSRLHAARAEAGARLAIAASGGRTHPVVGLWPVSLREDVRVALSCEDVRKMGRFTARHPLAIAEWPVAAVDPFFNINTAEDLAAAERARGGDVDEKQRRPRDRPAASGR